MRRPVTEDDVEMMEATTRKPADHRTAAARLTACADEPVPGDEPSPAELLVAAAWHREQADEQAAALDLYRRAVLAPGNAAPDTRCWLHGALLASGLLVEARQLADEIRRGGPADLAVYEVVGENYEEAGDLAQAHRWFTMGTRLVDVDALAAEDDPFGYALVRARRRVRRLLELPLDALDEMVAPIPWLEGEG
jgi:hypothetical protein